MVWLLIFVEIKFSWISLDMIIYELIYVTGFGKTDHNVTNDITRNTDLKY